MNYRYTWNALEDISQRLVMAEQELRQMSNAAETLQQIERLDAKREGVRLALSYVEEEMRLLQRIRDKQRGTRLRYWLLRHSRGRSK